MANQQYILSVISGERQGLVARGLRGALSILAYVYVAGLKLFLLPYRIGIRRRAKLPCTVISVGNLTVGGTGKTPITRLVCEFLTERGLRVCVLSRGYRGANEHNVAVVSTTKRVELDAKAAGDEAHLLATQLPGVPVLVGKDRRVSGGLACAQFTPQVIVLDDGMQFYQLHRDLDIVLLDAQRPFDNGWTFPRGLLREPPSHLRRARAVIITNVDKAPVDAVEALKRQVASLAPKAHVYTAQYGVECLRALDRSGEQHAAWLKDRKVVSFCALGNPSHFEQQLAASGANVVESVRLPDHHSATMGDINAMIARAQELGAEAIVVTEKDAVKLPPLGRPIPFYALIVRQQVTDGSEFYAQLLGVLPR